MFELLKKLCLADATSGDETAVRDIIISEIDGFCDWKIDNCGNILVEKKGKKRSVKRLMLDAHTDEVGLIISGVTAEGCLKFKTVGGIDTAVMAGRRVRINGKLPGVIGIKPIHLLKGDDAKKLPKEDALYIDIGAADKDDALKYVSLGDRAVILGEWIENEEKILSKALDDRVGCAVLIKLLREASEYDFCASFSWGEEVGLRGAKTAAFALNPQSAIVLEGTTAADIASVSGAERVCELSKGVVVSFMDRSTVYDREYYNRALSSGLLCQTKTAVSGGNDSGAIHLCREGVRTIALSAPCRYIHSASSVVDKRDITAMYDMAKYMINGICSGEIK
ncbi:MAG: M42 family metallopeptidase [Ruminococcaceae bacterium]|nr:M42 family metallopeptidase [Oscillospiraceae bacterium]